MPNPKMRRPRLAMPLLASFLIVAAPIAANATTAFNFSYEFGVEDIVLTGMFTGDLQPDGDTIENIGDLMVAVNGIDMGPLFYAGGRLDGSLSTAGGEQFGGTSNGGFSMTNIFFDYAPGPGGIVFVRCEEPGTPDCGLVGIHTESFDPSRWKAEVKVPEPSAAMLFVAGALVLGRFVRRPTR